jgi:hypothetical protein
VYFNFVIKKFKKMQKKYSTADLVKLQHAMKEYLKQTAHGSKLEYCLYCNCEKIDIWPENFIPMCASCNIEISQMLEYFFDKYPEMVEDILSNGEGSN